MVVDVVVDVVVVDVDVVVRITTVAVAETAPVGQAYIIKVFYFFKFLL